MSASSLDLLWPALVAGLLVLSTHVPLGRIVLARGIVFIDLALAQVAGLGVVVADALGAEPQGWIVQASATAAALAGAALLVAAERRHPEVQEAVIGVVFAFSASAEIILLGFNPHGAEHLKDLLVGQILWVTPWQLLPVAALYAVLLLVWRRVDIGRQRAAFYVSFALAITASVQLVGIFLVFASLVVPALAARVAGARAGLAWGVGVAGYVLGLVGSAAFDLPTGAAIVCALVVVAAAATGVGPAARARPAG